MRHIIKRCREVLASHYGKQLNKIVLYGSTARNEGDPESDIDILVVLNHTFDYFQELRTLAEILYSVQVESDQLISAKPVSSDDYERGALQLYRNAKHEGVLV